MSSIVTLWILTRLNLENIQREIEDEYDDEYDEEDFVNKAPLSMSCCLFSPQYIHIYIYSVWSFNSLLWELSLDNGCTKKLAIDFKLYHGNVKASEVIYLHAILQFHYLLFNQVYNHIFIRLQFNDHSVTITVDRDVFHAVPTKSPFHYHSQWPFQELKLEVPTISQAYFLGLWFREDPLKKWPKIWYSTSFYIHHIFIILIICSLYIHYIYIYSLYIHYISILGSWNSHWHSGHNRGIAGRVPPEVGSEAIGAAVRSIPKWGQPRDVWCQGCWLHLYHDMFTYRS